MLKHAATGGETVFYLNFTYVPAHMSACSGVKQLVQESATMRSCDVSKHTGKAGIATYVCMQ